MARIFFSSKPLSLFRMVMQSFSNTKARAGCTSPAKG
uniref:Uncharacterized protein n=1 Tax=Anguilla anguilla TaxID=7936 RepID=A0A0E9RTA6_ANGAN